MDKSFRIHTNIISDTLLKVNMQQDFDFLEVLSLKLRQKDAYRLHSSNYGVIIGRVLANDAFGIPNAKVSIFIERDTNDSTDMEALYPYSEVSTKDKEGRRYNILPDYSDDDCYRVVGTFPNKRLMLDDDIQLEIYEKYYKYTTVTNNAGDYMIFGVPTGSVTVHVDIDLSDIGVLSQKPRDFEYKGYNLTMFDSPNQFKESTNLDGLAQIFSQNRSVFVYPFWGDADNGIASITRADIQIQYKFEPTCVFIGSIVSDNEGHAIGHKCAPDVDNGMNDQLVGGSGTIEMIRRTTDGLVEEYQIQGNQLIDENGVWCYQIPMNLDYIGTDEYGNVVPTDNPTKGIPTRTQVRFRISKNETADEGFSRHTAKYLVPMNPIFSENVVEPYVTVPGSEVEKMYNFGSNTPISCFRDLYWNNVYSVKNYIPKVQVAHRPYSKNYGGLKGANLAEDRNQIPFNKLRVDMPFTYMIICIVFTLVVYIVTFINMLLCAVLFVLDIVNWILKKIKKILNVLWLGGLIPTLDVIMPKCIVLSAGLTEGNDAFYPGCWCGESHYGECPEEMEGDCNKIGDFHTSELIDRIQRNLALDYKIIKLDFYQDWLNGCLYMPLWYWRKRKKKTFLFFTLSRAKNEYCSSTVTYSRLKTYVTCDVPYSNSSLELDQNYGGETRWHKNKKAQVRYKRGLINPVQNKDNLTVYYYTALQATSDNEGTEDLPLNERERNFYAVRLYATDIILLGNLNEKNLYGIPQFFKCLPPTTANIPAIATIEEDSKIENPDEEELQYDASEETDSGATTITTGMDWGNEKRAEDTTPQYKKGLFMDLACTYAKTRGKSCINVERLSELGVSLDMQYNMKYANSSNSKIQEGEFYNDGFINKLELDDTENRAMFATMNHIGFIPQSYQESINAYTTQISDDNTNYFVNKFKYIYPVDFDGRQSRFMEDYGSSAFEQPLYDETDESYLTFRLGAENSLDLYENSENRIRHFYKVPNKVGKISAKDDHFHMPLYNNSFYFYFGIKMGSTAIDKFNQMFLATCSKKDKKPFSTDITSRSRSYCPEAYDEIQKGYGYISIYLDDIKKPYSYSLFDANDEIVVAESGMTTDFFVIGGHADNRTTDVDCTDFYVREFKTQQQVNNVYGQESGLTNQEYILEITDNDSNKVSEKITLDKPKIIGKYESFNLTSKFYNTATTRIDYICHDDNNFYGEIDLTGFTIDGYDCTITDAKYVGYDSTKEVYKVCVTGTSLVSSEKAVAMLELSVLHKEYENFVKDCLCDTNNNVADSQSASDKMQINEANVENAAVFLGLNDNINADGKKVQFFIYQPNDFMMKITQYCVNCDENEVVDNSSSTIITILNGQNFNTYLNDMPTRFIIGTINDSSAATIGNTSRFYNRIAQTDPTTNNINGWFGVHQEDSYQFDLPINTTIEENQESWEDFLTFNESIKTHKSKRNIILYKFRCMFSLSDAVYAIDKDFTKLNFTRTGGRERVILRSISPVYTNQDEIFNTYIFKDSASVNVPCEFTNIVGYNNSGHTDCSNYVSSRNPQFNKMFIDREYLGNYFAGFDNNAMYINNSTIDKDTFKDIARQPNFSSISPYSSPSSRLKVRGTDEKASISNLKLAHTTSISAIGGLQTLQPKPDKSRLTNPWLRGMVIDRRLDYDFIVMGPSNNINFKLHNDANKERPWKSLRISGFTYNGIEMSYDIEKNIISAKTTANEGDIISAERNRKLEYSYSFNGDIDENVKTYYNFESNEFWGSWHNINYKGKNFGYNPTIDDGDEKQYIKELYVAEFANFDVRNFFWSTFNAERLNNYIKDSVSGQSGSGVTRFQNTELPFYVFQYPYGKVNDFYNYYWERDTLINNVSYPTKRFIDIANIEPAWSYKFNTESCSYKTTPKKLENGEIISIAKSEEAVEFEIKFEPLIEFIPPSSSNDEYGNVIYICNGEKLGYTRFIASGICLSFRYNIKTSENFDVYTTRPKVIRVLPYTHKGNIVYSDPPGTDGISYYKSANDYSEFDGNFADGKSLKDAIGDVTFYEFNTSSSIPFLGMEKDTFMPSGVNFRGGFKTKLQKDVDGIFFEKNNEFLKSSDNDFNNIVFKKDIPLKNADIRVFTILAEREYVSKEDNMLTRHIRTVEISDIFDSREILIKIVPTVSGVNATYVVKQHFADVDVDVTEIHGNTSTDIPPSEEGGEGSQASGEITDGGGSGSGTTDIYLQVITFEMYFKLDDEPINLQNQAFGNYSMMGYTFVFTNGTETYRIPCNEFTFNTDEETYAKIRFVVRWSQDMGILCDDKWTNCFVTLYAKATSTGSNFIYKLNRFRLSHPECNKPTDYGFENSTITDTNIICG